MRILHTAELYAPVLGGAQEVVRQISERLVARGHEVTVATTRVAGRAAGPIGGVQIAEFDIAGNAARGFTGEAERYERFLLEGDFDVMLNYAAQQWTADLAMGLLERLPYPALLAPCGFSGLLDPAYRDYFAALPERAARYRELILHSTTYRDAAFLREHGVANTRLIPNGADEREFGEPGDPGAFRRAHDLHGVPLLLTVGGHTGQKGHREAIDALGQMRRRAALVLVGNKPFGRGCSLSCDVRGRWVGARSLGRRRVLALDPPRAGVVEAYRAADLFVLASNIECSPIVLFEAMASGTPFVSADVGNAAEIAEWSDSGVIVPTRHGEDGRSFVESAALVDAVEALLADVERRRAMAAAGRAAWRRQFTWDVISRRYEAAYEDAIAGR
ncbi:MAG: glycosyltransferase family 4 protein [Solirubrobacteraceae bacterium]|nr:glycosyltransferase family 4 protein [Solirubrobacteraceae bacterium]